MNDIRTLKYLHIPQSYICDDFSRISLCCTMYYKCRAASREYNLKLTSSVFAIIETASVCCSCTLVAVFSLWWHMSRPQLFLMTLTGPSVGDVLLDTPGRCAGARRLCIIEPSEGEWMPKPHAMPISVDPLGERPISAEAAPEVWLDRRASVHWTLLYALSSTQKTEFPSGSAGYVAVKDTAE